jgi:hypothetical protein
MTLPFALSPRYCEFLLGLLINMLHHIKWAHVGKVTVLTGLQSEYNLIFCLICSFARELTKFSKISWIAPVQIYNMRQK